MKRNAKTNEVKSKGANVLGLGMYTFVFSYSGNRTATSNDTGSHDDRKHEEQTSMYSACILSANCLSNATHMLQELTGQLQT